MANPFTAKRGGIFIQPGGPNTEKFYLGCHTAGDIAEAEGGIELLRCFKADGTGWEVKGSTITPPDPVTFSIEARMSRVRSWIQRIEFPASFYFLQSEAGRRDNPKNYDSGMVVGDARRSTKTRSGVAHMEEDSAAMVATEWEAYPPIYEIDTLTGERKTTVATNGLNDIWMNPDSHDYASWGSRQYKGELGLIVGDSAVAPALATCLFATAYTDTLAQSAAAPMAAGASLMSCGAFYVGQSMRRYVACLDAPAGGQGMIAYSDNGGAAWTQVNIGGAVAGHGANYGGSLWAPNESFSLLAGAAGYIYKSVDGAVTWTAVEPGTIAVSDYSCAHADETDTYCIAGGPADNIVLSEDGGETWVVATATGGGGDILCCWRFDENNMWVGTDDGELWYSDDGGVTWTERTSFVGTGVGDIRDMYWQNRHVGYVAYNSAAPLGKVMRTIDGGYSWEDLTTPTNSGLNAIVAPDINLVYVVGEVNGGTGFICRHKSVGVDLPIA